MGLAPRPGTTPNANARKKPKRSGFRIRIYNDVWELHLRDIGPGDEGLVRQTTGRPFSSYLSEQGLDSMGVILWMARRKAGEKKLTLAKVFEQIPNYYDLADMTENDEFDFEPVEDFDGEEAEEIIDIDSEEVSTHPLPSAEA